MASLVDRGLVDAVRSATDSKRNAIRDIISTAGESVGGIGAGLVDRKQELDEKRAKLRAYQDALSNRKKALETERAKLIDMNKTYGMADDGELSEVDKKRSMSTIDRDAKIRSIDKRLGEIGATEERMPVGENMNFRNFRNVNIPQLEARQDYDPTVEMEEFQQDREYTIAQDQAMQAEAAERAKQQQRAADIEREDYWKQKEYELKRQGLQAKSAAPSEYEKTLQRKQATKAVEQQEDQEAATKAHERLEGTLLQMEAMINKYGDDLFGSETLSGMASETFGRLFGTDLAGVRKEFDLLVSGLVEDAVKARKGTGTISDKDLEVIQQGVVNRTASDAKTAKNIISQILSRSARSAGKEAPEPEAPKPKAEDLPKADDLVKQGGVIQ